MIKVISIALALGSVFAGLGCIERGTNGSAVPGPTPMTNTDVPGKGDYLSNLPKGFVQPTDDVGKKLLNEYGAVFVASGVTVPTTVVFKDEAAVTDFQKRAGVLSEVIGGVKVELQAAALNALKAAIAEAATSNIKISPRGADSARRTYKHTVDLWASRVNPGLAHWTAAGRIARSEAKRIRSLTPYEQVPEILKLEERGIFFSKDFSKSIIYSVAPPGTSQHLSMLALDVAEFDSSQVRSILAKHGWFQTVTSDLPHFTYLGVPETDLPKLGLKKVVNADRNFWVPDL
jgi:hypothetical protein